MKKFLVLLIAFFCVLSTTQLKAQDYKAAVGLSLGGNMGVNAKVFISGASAIEGGVDYTFHHNAVNFFAVWQYHLQLIDGLYGYAGAGFNIGAQHLGYNRLDHRGSDFNFGLDPNVGFEYKFNASPITVGVDYRPSINIVGHSLWSSMSVKLRYTF